MIQKGGRVRLDVLDELSKMTLDVIGLAGKTMRLARVLDLTILLVFLRGYS